MRKNQPRINALHGFISRVHVESLRRLGNVEVAGVAGSGEERAQRFADEHSIEWAAGDYRELLEDPGIQAVHICTPNSLHFDQTMSALSAGKHVVCEKPLAANIDEAKQMLAAASDSGLLHCTVYNVRGYPQVQNMRRLCEGGYFGDVWLVRGTYSQDWLLHDTDWNWRVSEGPSRAFADIGTHWCDLAEHITGLRISSLSASLQTFVTRRKKPQASVETFQGKTFRSGRVHGNQRRYRGFCLRRLPHGRSDARRHDGEPGLGRAQESNQHRDFRFPGFGHVGRRTAGGALDWPAGSTQ